MNSVVERYEGQLVSYAARMLGDVDRARDVTQDTFLRLCQANRSLVEDRVKQWLFAVCRNRAMDVLKKEQRMKTIGGAEAAACPNRDGDPTRRLEHQEAVGRASAVLATLPENQQEVVRLKVKHGLSYREISEVTGLSESNVGFLLHAAVKTIRQRLAASGSL